MPLSADRPQPEQSLQTQSHWIDKLAIATTSRRGLFRTVAGLAAAAVASKFGIAHAQSSGYVWGPCRYRYPTPHKEGNCCG
jgi:hypothetical protein